MLEEMPVAIVNTYNANNPNAAALRLANTGNLHISQAPQGTDYPYIVFHIIASSPDHNMSNYIENSTVQFSIYTNDSLDTVKLFGKLNLVFDDQDITYSQQINLRCSRTGVNGPERETDSTGRTIKALNDVWLITADYQFMRQVDFN